MEDMVNEGIVLTENGIEFPRFGIMGVSKANYEDIESVELVPFPKSLTLRLRYSPSVISTPSGRWKFSLGTVVIKFKPPYAFQYHLFTPTDPAQLVKELKSRIDKRAIRV